MKGVLHYVAFNCKQSFTNFFTYYFFENKVRIFNFLVTMIPLRQLIVNLATTGLLVSGQQIEQRSLPRTRGTHHRRHPIWQWQGNMSQAGRLPTTHADTLESDHGINHDEMLVRSLTQWQAREYRKAPPPRQAHRLTTWYHAHSASNRRASP